MVRRVVVFVVVFAALGSTLVFSSSAAKADANTRASAVYTITYYDSMGHIERVWHGTQAQQQAILQADRANRPTHRPSSLPPDILPTGSNIGAHSQRAASVNPDINRVYGCTAPNDFWDVWNYPPLVCFANAGTISVSIYDVYEVDSGNNTGWFSVYPGYFPQFNVYINSKFSSAECGGCTWYDVTSITIN